MSHHFDIHPILDIVAAQERDFAVYDHVLRMEGTNRRYVVVLDLHIDTWNLIRRRELHFRSSVGLHVDRLMRRNDLRRVASVVHYESLFSSSPIN